MRAFRSRLNPGLIIVLAALAALAQPVVAETGTVSAAPSAPASAAVMGDVNCGGSVDSVDSLQILRHAAGLSTNAACMVPAGDVDCDGDNDAVDSLRILRHVAGLSNTTPDGCTPIGDPTGGTLLNEVLFLPPPGDDQFVEIEGGGSLDGLTLVDESAQTFALPGGLPSLGPDEVLLIVFDGGNSAAGNVVHASPAGFLDSASGWVQLRDGPEVLDRVAWGDGQLAAVPLGRGGVIEEPEPGMTIGRVPDQTATSDRFAWISFSPGHATPGQPNGVPVVDIALPPDGAIFGAGDATLSWYPVAGASQYRAVVATEDSFAAPLIDQTSADTRVSTGSLSPGDYFWRVVAEIAGYGASVSATQMFTIDGAASSVATQAAPASALTVPYLSQHKDTRMLLLESERPTGGHAWDKPHLDLDTSDPADNTNCVLASLAMINHSFGGDVSQDRIGYEVRKDRQPGPEMDLNYGDGLFADQIAAAFQLALGVAPEKFAMEGSTADQRLAFITDTIDGGHPISASIPGHAIVVTGYLHDPNPLYPGYVVVYDPWSGQYNLPADTIQLTRLWRPSAAPQPASDEPGISADSDGDGIVDFDETNRFHTKPLEEDTDGDDVLDKEDVKESVFGAWGYSAFGVVADKAPRDWDGDGLPNERDCDSDNDGIKDGDDPDDYSDPPDPPVPAGCLTDFVGSASAVIHVDSGIYTVNVSGLRFQQIETTGPVVHYALTESPAVTWQASGTTYCPPFTCHCDGAPMSGQMTLQPADGTSDDGKVFGVLDTNLETHTYSGRINGYDYGAAYSYTCPDDFTGQLPFASPDIMYTGNNWIAIAADGRLDGVNEDPGFYTSAHWEWHLEPAPPPE